MGMGVGHLRQRKELCKDRSVSSQEVRGREEGPSAHRRLCEGRKAAAGGGCKGARGWPDKRGMRTVPCGQRAGGTGKGDLPTVSDS